MAEFDLDDFVEPSEEKQPVGRKKVASLHYEVDTPMYDLIHQMRSKGIKPADTVAMIVLSHIKKKGD